ncbi:hypothetical protein CRG98_045032, partial [Punica granatum]
GLLREIGPNRPNGPDWVEWTAGLLDAVGLGRTLTGCRCWTWSDWADASWAD